MIAMQPTQTEQVLDSTHNSNKISISHTHTWHRVISKTTTYLVHAYASYNCYVLNTNALKKFTVATHIYTSHSTKTFLKRCHFF